MVMQMSLTIDMYVLLHHAGLHDHIMLYLSLYLTSVMNIASISSACSPKLPQFTSQFLTLGLSSCCSCMLRALGAPRAHWRSVHLQDKLSGFQDNDSLAKELARELNADLLVLLTNVDGLMDGPPKDRNSK